MPTRGKRAAGRELEWRQRGSDEYRAERLQAEHDRLSRRLEWAIRRGDERAADRLSRRLDALEDDQTADTSPGRPPNKFDRHWRG